MTVYALARFLHVVGSLGMVVMLGLEWVGQAQLRRARTAEQARAGAQLVKGVRWLAPASGIALLLPAFYMMGTVWTQGAPWIRVSVGALVLLLVVSALGARARAAAVNAALSEQGEQHRRGEQ